MLEIGCGTGNATLPFIRTGADITAVELGENLADFTAEKYRRYSNFNIMNVPFEEYRSQIQYDLFFSATAFHWVKNDFSYSRCRELLKEGGALAVFWSTPRISDENPELKFKIQDLYRSYMPDDVPEDLNIDEWFGKRRQNTDYLMGLYGYCDFTSALYTDTRTFNADEYIGLLHTYSDHMALQNPRRDEFFNKIHSIIEKSQSVTLTDTIDLYMGRKKSAAGTDGLRL